MRHIAICGAALAMASFFCLVAAAYETQLSSEAIREAYFLGQRKDEKTAVFLSQYVQHLPLPKTGPYVSEAEILTPYAQAVQLSMRHATGYSAQQAEQDYKGRGDTLRVRVMLRFTPTYPLQAAFSSSQKVTGNSGIRLRAEDFWRDFTFTLTQKQEGEERTLEPYDVWSEPYYLYRSETTPVLDGAEVWLLLDAAEVASDPVKLDVGTPDGQHVPVVFDLSKLR